MKKDINVKKGVVLVIVAAVIALYLSGIRLYQGKFLPNTYLLGQKISSMTENEAVATIKNATGSYFKVIELGGKTEKISLEDIDYSVDYETLVHSVYTTQTPFSWPIALFYKSEGVSRAECTFNEDKLKTAVHNLDGISGDAIVAPVDAYIRCEGGEYEVVQQVDGNTLKEETVYEVVKNALQGGASEVVLDDNDCYVKASITTDSPEIKELLEKIKIVNCETITINMVDAEEILEADDILDLIDIDGKDFTVNEDKLEAYVDTLEEKYNTIKKPHKFTTTDGEDIEVGGSSSDTFGYDMSTEETCNRIKEAILAKKDSTIDAAWDVSGLGRDKNGRDIGDTYIEVSITKQHLWYYIDGELQLESDVVTGTDNGSRNTPTGAFRIWSKQLNATLKGQGYSTPVGFWMPITWDGVGLHDATWRSTFGGTIYKYSGSHGCVNLPYSIAKEIYSLAEVNTPVIIY